MIKTFIVKDFDSPIRFVTAARRLGCSFTQIRAMIEIQDRHCLGEDHVLDLVSSKITEAEAGLAKGEQQGEFG